MKVCKICGKAMSDSYSMCPYCGCAELDYLEDSAPRQDQQQFEPNVNPSANQQQPPFGVQPDFSESYYPPQQPVMNVNTDYTPAPRPQRSAYVAAILAFVLGCFGFHNFYLGKQNRALCQLLVTLLGSVITFGLAAIGMYIWAAVEGLKLLSGKINTDGEGQLIKMSF